MFAAEIVHAGGAVHAPAARPERFHDESAGFEFLRHSSEDFLENVLDGDHSGGPSEFIEHDGHASLLAFQAFEKLQQVHAFGYERWKFHRILEIRMRVEQQGVSI